MHEPVRTRAGSQIPRSAEIAHGLGEAIHARRLGPGAKLGEDELGEIYGVSRTVVRAALQHLSHQGLVEMKPHKGAFVSTPSPREAREVFEARALLEPSMARRAATSLRPGDVERLRRHIAEETAAIRCGETGNALRLSGLFHIEIARIADQQIVAGFVEGLIMRSSLVIGLYGQQPSTICDCAAHLHLVDAIAERDPCRAETLMVAHLAELLAALDLRDRPVCEPKLREILLGED